MVSVAMTQKKILWSCALIVILISTSLGGAGTLADTPPTIPTEPVVIRLYVQDKAHLDAVAGELDIWEAHPEQGYVLAAVKPAEYQWLLDLGYEVEIDAAKTAERGIHAPLDPRFHYFDDYYPNPYSNYMVDFQQDIVSAYPGITHLMDIGDAWLAGQPGEYDRDILALRITNEDPAYGDIDEKPAFYLFGGIHAREVAIPELVIRYIKYLTGGYNGEGGYGVDPDVTWLVNHNVIYLQVSQNPDGHWKNEEEVYNDRRKNMDWDDGCNDPASWGVDLNRNHSYRWGCCGGSSGNPCSTTYRGPAAASEPETQAFQNFFTAVMEDQNGDNDDSAPPPAAPITTTGIFISLHSYSDIVIWPWGFDDPEWGDPPNMAELTTIGRKFAYYSDYDPVGSIWYDVDGPTDDWTYGMFGIASYTFEVGPSYGACGGFFPDYECLEGEAGRPENFWAENKPAFIFAHKIARTPYMTAYGPDTEDMAATPDTVPQGSPVELTAAIADHRYDADPLQPIYGAEYFVDAPGEDGTGVALSPSDGSWGDLYEEVETVVDTSALAPGKHYILVHGLNDDGDWGPFSAVFVTTTLNVAPEVIELEVSPTSIPIVQGQAAVTASLTLSDSTPVPGWPVTFTTDAGTVSPLVAYSDADGHAVATLFAADTPGTAHVTAEAAGMITGPVDVEFYIPAAPTAGFTSNSPVCIHQDVLFTNTTISPPLAPAGYVWDFGDGTATSTETHPVHTYAYADLFTVTLTATNAGGSNTFTDTVSITPTSEAGFDYSPTFPQLGETVYFTDTSSQDPIAWDWDFGDGGSSTAQNPHHTFWISGPVTVTLTAGNQCGWGAPHSEVLTIGAEPPQFRIYLPIVVKSE